MMLAAKLEFIHVLGFFVLLALVISIPLWGRAVGWPFRLAWWLLILPVTGLAWARDRRRARRAFECAEVLSRYLGHLGQSPALVDYYRGLVAGGIEPQALERMLQRHVVQVKETQAAVAVQDVLASTQVGAELLRLTSEQEKVLAEGKVQMERMKFQASAIEGLAEQLKNKYVAKERP